MNELIDLQSAHATQTTTGGDKGAWMIRKNITNDDLFKLPGHMSEQDVFLVLKFARQFELIALNAGIEFGKQQNQTNLHLARDENDRLASAMDKLTRGE